MASKSAPLAVHQPSRPVIMGMRHVISAGHYLAAQAGFQVLEAGGNAIDAGVAAGLVIGVVESQYVGVSGVAPILIYLKEKDELVTIDGLGTWPKAASCEYFRKNHDGKIPKGIVRTIVPAAADAWITALERFGTMGFGEVAAAAIGFARDGFPMYPIMAEIIESEAADACQWPSTAAIFFPGGRVPEVGKPFVQSDLGRALQYMADEERAAATRGRAAGLKAARDAFYRGDIAAAIVRFQKEQGGLLTAEDLAGYRVTLEPPVHVRFGDVDVYGCGPWCQGPMMLQSLSILDHVDLKGLGHNSVAYLHMIAEAIKLAAADREAYYGDPKFVDVPMERLLSPQNGQARRTMIRPDSAWLDLPPASDVGPGRRPSPAVAAAGGARAGLGRALDTSYVCVVDQKGNAFSSTPSGSNLAGPVVPGIGMVTSARGGQSWTDPAHPSSVAPGKRPRLTPNPALAMRRGEFVMPFGTPGHDVQTQVMLQAFLNIFVFAMDLQSAVEAPRIATYSFPSSTFPHQSNPGLLHVEAPIGRKTRAALAALGHKAELWPESGPVYLQSLNAVCAVLADERTGVMQGAADPRRPTYAVGW